MDFADHERLDEHGSQTSEIRDPVNIDRIDIEVDLRKRIIGILPAGGVDVARNGER